MAKKQETGLTLAQVNSAVTRALDKQKKDQPKRKPITENPTYKKLQEKLDSTKNSLKRAKEKAEEAYNTNSIVGSLVKGAIAVPYGWLRNKTRLIDKLPGATLANGAIPDFLIGATTLGLALYGKEKGWGRTLLTGLSDLSDVAMINSGLKMGSSISTFDTTAEAINNALAVSGVPQQGLPVANNAAEARVIDRFSWG